MYTSPYLTLTFTLYSLPQQNGGRIWLFRLGLLLPRRGNNTLFPYLMFRF